MASACGWHRGSPEPGAVGDIGRRQVEHQQAPVSAHREVTLAPYGLLAAIKASLGPMCGGLYSPAVENATLRTGIATAAFTINHQCYVVDSAKQHQPDERAKDEGILMTCRDALSASTAWWLKRGALLLRGQACEKAPKPDPDHAQTIRLYQNVDMRPVDRRRSTATDIETLAMPVVIVAHRGSEKAITRGVWLTRRRQGEPPDACAGRLP